MNQNGLFSPQFAAGEVRRTAILHPLSPKDIHAKLTKIVFFPTTFMEGKHPGGLPSPGGANPFILTKIVWFSPIFKHGRYPSVLPVAYPFRFTKIGFFSISFTQKKQLSVILLAAVGLHTSAHPFRLTKNHVFLPINLTQGKPPQTVDHINQNPIFSPQNQALWGLQ